MRWQILNYECMRIGCADNAHVSSGASVGHICMIHRNPSTNVVFQLEKLMLQARQDDADGTEALARLTVAVPLPPQVLHVTRFMSPESLVAVVPQSQLARNNPYHTSASSFPMHLWDQLALKLPNLPQIEHRTLYTLPTLSLPLPGSLLRFVIQFSIDKLYRLGYGRKILHGVDDFLSEEIVFASDVLTTTLFALAEGSPARLPSSVFQPEDFVGLITDALPSEIQLPEALCDCLTVLCTNDALFVGLLSGRCVMLQVHYNHKHQNQNRFHFRWYNPDNSVIGNNTFWAAKSNVEKLITNNVRKNDLASKNPVVKSESVLIDGYSASKQHAVWSCDFVLLAALRLVYAKLLTGTADPKRFRSTAADLLPREADITRFRLNLQRDLSRLVNDTEWRHRLTRMFILSAMEDTSSSDVGVRDSLDVHIQREDGQYTPQIFSRMLKISIGRGKHCSVKILDDEPGIAETQLCLMWDRATKCFYAYHLGGADPSIVNGKSLTRRGQQIALPTPGKSRLELGQSKIVYDVNVVREPPPEEASH